MDFKKILKGDKEKEKEKHDKEKKSDKGEKERKISERGEKSEKERDRSEKESREKKPEKDKGDKGEKEKPGKREGLPSSVMQRGNGSNKDGSSPPARQSGEGTVKPPCACLTCPEIEVPIESWQSIATQKGFLEKKSDNSSKWHKRFVVLHNNYLYYYRSPTSKRPAGVVLLDGAKISKVQRIMVEEEENRVAGWAIHILSRCGRTAVFSTNSMIDRDHWVYLMRQASYETVYSSLIDTGRRVEFAQKILKRIQNRVALSHSSSASSSLPDSIEEDLKAVQRVLSSFEADEETVRDGEEVESGERESCMEAAEKFLSEAMVVPATVTSPSWEMFGKKEERVTIESVRQKMRGSHNSNGPEGEKGGEERGSNNLSTDGGHGKAGERANIPPLSLEEALRLADSLAESNDSTLLTTFLTTVSRRDQISVTLPLMRLFVPRRAFFKLFQWAIEVESSEMISVAKILRGEGLAPKLLSQYLKLVGLDYLKRTIGPLVEKLCKEIIRIDEIELDPAKLPGASGMGERERAALLEKNASRLMSLVQSFLDDVCESDDLVLDSCRHIWHYLFAICTDQYDSGELEPLGNDGQEAWSSVGAMYFLRFICPAITDPLRYDLVREQPSIHARRSLIIVSKIVNNIANGIQFGHKEPHLMAVNGFIVSNMKKVQDFYSFLGSLPSGNADEAILEEWRSASEGAEGSAGEDFSPTPLADMTTIREVMAANYQDLQSRLKAYPEKIELLNQLVFSSPTGPVRGSHQQGGTGERHGQAAAAMQQGGKHKIASDVFLKMTTESFV